VNFFASSFNNPTSVILFSKRNNVLYKMIFCHLTQQCRSNAAVDIARIHEDLTNTAGIKYKYGIQVPKGIKNAIELNKIIETNYGKKLLIGNILYAQAN
jgi:hypothetical protein